MTPITLQTFQALFGWVPDKALDGKYADAADRQVLNTLNRFRQPARVMEIGVNEGRTAELLLRTSPWISHYCGVDVFPEFVPAWDHQRSEIPAKDKAGHLARDSRFHLILSTIGTYTGLQKLTGADYDLIFIDADHTFKGVSRDTDLALSVASPRACIVWHDYANDCPDVPRFLDQYSASAPVLHVLGTRIAFRFLT